MISDMGDLLPLVDFFLGQGNAGKSKPFSFPAPLVKNLKHPFWMGGSTAGTE